MDVMAEAERERSELAERVAQLPGEHWDAPSLRAGWRVRDVVAHVVSHDGPGVRELAERAPRGRLSLDRMVRVDRLGTTGLATGAR